MSGRDRRLDLLLVRNVPHDFYPKHPPRFQSRENPLSLGSSLGSCRKFGYQCAVGVVVIVGTLLCVQSMLSSFSMFFEAHKYIKSHQCYSAR